MYVFPSPPTMIPLSHHPLLECFSVSFPTQPSDHVLHYFTLTTMLLWIYVPATGFRKTHYLAGRYADVELSIFDTEVVLRCRLAGKEKFRFNAFPHFPTAAVAQSSTSDKVHRVLGCYDSDSTLS
jgi:hypothetical protein